MYCFVYSFAVKVMETEKEKEKGKDEGHVKEKSLNYFYMINF